MALYFVGMLLLMPITMSLYMFRLPWVEQFVKPPVNKFILDTCSFIYLVLMIFIKVYFEYRPGRGDALGALDVLIFIWVIGLTVRYLGISIRRKDCWLSFINAENSDWRFHENLALVFFWVYYLIMIVLWAMVKAGSPKLTRERLETWDAYLVAEAAFALASILTVIQVYSFFKVSSSLGPLQVSMKKMIFDVTKFLVLFLVVLSAFAVGLSYLYSGYNGYSSFNHEKNITEVQEDYFQG